MLKFFTSTCMIMLLLGSIPGYGQSAELINSAQTRSTKPTNSYIIDDAGRLTLDGNWTLDSNTDGKWYTVSQTFVPTPAMNTTVSGNSVVVITFNEVMDMTSVNTGIAVENGMGQAISGGWSQSGATLTFTPTSQLFPGETISIKINESLVGTTGAWTPVTYEWSFIINNQPNFTSAEHWAVDENSTTAALVTVDHAVGASITYSLTGPDATLFTITNSGNDGNLTFVSPPNFESPADANTDNVYEVTVTASDGPDSRSQNITISVGDVNDAPVFTSNSTIQVDENQTAVQTVVAVDEDTGASLTYSLVVGADQSLFAINSTTGVLTFTTAPNFENPGDVDTNNQYEVTVRVTDNTHTVQQSLTVTVNDVNDPPSFTSATAVNVDENQTTAQTVVATDEDAGTTLTYEISGGADQSLFTINGTTGVLTFLATPDYEIPVDNNADNQYDLIVQVTDNTNPVQQSLTVTVHNVNEPPVFTSGTAVQVDENQTAVQTVLATDVDAGTTLTYSISGGVDQSLFAIDGSTGVLTFVATPNFENPGDVDTNNQYVFTVQVTDNTNTVQQGLTVTVNNVNEPPSFTSATAVNVDENQTAVQTVVATDEDAGATLTYSISGGADQSLFAINGTTGILTFLVAPDYDIPGDNNADNQYDLIVQVTDNTNPVQQSLTVTVNNVNEPPVFISGTAVQVDENQTAVQTVLATDVDAGTTLTYSISGGADQSLFTINGTTGVLSFTNAPNFETPGDVDANNQYVVTVQVTDNTNTVQQGLTVTVNNVNEPPSFTSATAVNVDENQTAVQTVVATDEDAGASLTYSLAGGADQSLFAINGTTGVLTFLAAPDFDIPGDNNADNQYDLIVQVTDNTNPVQQSISVTVNDVNEPPVFTSSTTVQVNEEIQRFVQTVIATDQDAGSSLSYSLAGGTDQPYFSINSTTGELRFHTSKDFEYPSDANQDNVYQVIVQVTDQVNPPVQQAVLVTVVDLNENPSWVSLHTETVTENQTLAQNVLATDPDGDILTYYLAGGADESLFSLDGASGVLNFISPPNFESPSDFDGNNLYQVNVGVTDGSGGMHRTVFITVSDGNDAPVFTSSATINAAENQTAVQIASATDEDPGTSLTFSIAGGADQSLFTIDGTSGVLTFLTPPNYEIAGDANADNVYELTLEVTDGLSPVQQNLSVTVTDVNDQPVFTSATTVNVVENQTSAQNVSATDEDAGASLTYSLVGGVDQSLFSITGSGALTFLAAPNFEAAGDSNSDNVYDLTLEVTDGIASPVQQNLSVTVIDVNDAPVFTTATTINAGENQTSVQTVAATDEDPGTTFTYSIVGGTDQTLFNINASSGVLSFIAAPNYEMATDANTDNVYDLTLQVTDGLSPVQQNLSVTVVDANDSPVFTSATSVNLIENQTSVQTVSASDEDAGASLTYAIVGGIDQSLFTIDAANGILTFLAAPNFEAAGDANTDNIYELILEVTDGIATPVQQSLSVTVMDGNDSPVFSSPATISVDENQTTVQTVAATDEDPGTTLTYSIVGGSDQALFVINGVSGALSFVSAPNYDVAGDANLDNVYQLTVQVTDGLAPVQQSLSVTVNNVNELPIFTSLSAVSIDENQTAVQTVTASDEDAGTTLTYSLVGGADLALFTIDGASGALNFVTAPDFDVAGDANADNVYDLIVGVTDGVTALVQQSLTVTVNNVNEPPVFTSATTVHVNENLQIGYTALAIDQDAGTTLTYSIVGGTDQSGLIINSSTGVINFVSTPDFEVPGDANQDRIYELIVQATDGVNPPIQQNVTITIDNVVDAPTITSVNVASIPENTTSVLTVTAVGEVGTTLSFTTSGGEDQSLFSFNGANLEFQTSRNFELPADADANNIYKVKVRVADGPLYNEQDIDVTVTNVNEAPSIISSNNAVNYENQFTALVVQAIDEDFGAVLAYSIVGGTDQNEFTIDATKGDLKFINWPNFEAPTDADLDNIYAVQVQVSDGTFNVQQSIQIQVTNKRAFIAKYNVTNSDGTKTLSFPLVSSGTYNFTVNWGDGSSNIITSYNDPAASHTYPANGPDEYIVAIEGTLDGWVSNTSPPVYAFDPLFGINYYSWADALKIREILAWGEGVKFGDGNNFADCRYLTVTAGDTLDLTGVSSLNYLFNGCESITTIPTINDWDVSQITTMKGVFQFAKKFNSPLGGWNTSSVTDMSTLFDVAQEFNQDISTWDVSSVTNMNRMFRGAQKFNQPLAAWSTKMTNVQDAAVMFSDAYDFNQPIGSWQLNSLTQANAMFLRAFAFNQDLSGWASYIGQLTNLENMFFNAYSFDQDLGSWNVTNANNMNGFFSNTVSMSIANLDATLLGWSAQSVGSGIHIGLGSLQYCAAGAIAILEGKGWYIHDGVLSSSCSGARSAVNLDSSEEGFSTEELEDGYQLNIYPNPVVDVFTLELEDYEHTWVTLSDLSGKVLNAPVELQSNRTEFDLLGVESRIILVTLDRPDGAVILRIIRRD